MVTRMTSQARACTTKLSMSPSFAIALGAGRTTASFHLVAALDVNSAAIARSWCASLLGERRPGGLCLLAEISPIGNHSLHAFVGTTVTIRGLCSAYRMNGAVVSSSPAG